MLVLCINFFINGTRRAVLIFKESMGLFWYDRYKAIAEAFAEPQHFHSACTSFRNCGNFIGTFCSTVLTSVWVEPYIIYKYRLKRPVSEFFKTYAYYMLVMAGAWTIAECCCRITSGSPLFPSGLPFLYLSASGQSASVGGLPQNG